jgi:magnesium-transporting ATPase (P-type)
VDEMAIDVSTVFGQLESAGFFDWVLPFLLVFLIIFALLEKTKLLGTEGQNKSRKNLNVVLALIIGLIVVIQTEIVSILNLYLSKMAFFIILALIGLLAFGVFTGSGSLSGIPMGIGVIIAILAIIWALSPSLGLDIFNFSRLSDTAASWIIVLAFFALVVWFATRGEKKNEGGESFGDKLLEGLKGGK